MSTFTELAPSSTVVDMNTGGGGENNSSSNSSSLSGVATALSRAAAVLPSSEILQSRLSDIWSRSRSWTEFANTSQMSRPEPSELFERVQENLTYYAFNYLVILLILSALTILTSPLAFLGGMFIVAAYFYLFFLNPDAIKLGGIALDNKVKAAFIMIFSLVVLWVTGAGAAFTGLLLVVSVIALTHAAFRKPPGEADFETAYTPATV